MCAAIINPTSCQVHLLIKILMAKNIKPIEIHLKLCAVNGEDVLTAKWCEALVPNVSRWPQKYCNNSFNLRQHWSTFHFVGHLSLMVNVFLAIFKH